MVVKLLFSMEFVMSVVQILVNWRWAELRYLFFDVSVSAGVINDCVRISCQIESPKFDGVLNIQ